MRKSEKELKQEFENKKSETEKLAQKINIVIWKVKRPQDIKQADKIINKYKKILEILESEWFYTKVDLLTGSSQKFKSIS